MTDVGRAYLEAIRNDRRWHRRERRPHTSRKVARAEELWAYPPKPRPRRIVVDGRVLVRLSDRWRERAEMATRAVG